MPTLDLRKLGVVFSSFALLAFTACFLWRFTLPPDLQDIHLDSLRVAVKGFSGFTLGNYLLGLVQAYAWGWVVAAVFGSLWNAVNRR